MFLNTEERKLKIYEIKHPAFRKDVEILVQAESMQEAIEKFDKHYEHDYDVDTNEIESVVLKFDLEVIL